MFSKDCAGFCVGSSPRRGGEEGRGAAGTPVGGCYRSVCHVNMACTEMPVVQNVRCGWIQDVFEVG